MQVPTTPGPNPAAQMRGGLPGAAGGMPQTPPASPAMTAPGASPMATPQQPKGLQQAEKVHVMMSMDLLAQAIPALGPNSEEGQAVMKALQILSKQFGKTQDKSRELVPAEIMQLLSALPQAGGGNPGAKAMAMPGAGATPPPQ